MDRIKTVNGHLIKIMTKWEVNDELLAKGDWGIEYYVPGRTFNPYVITINRNRYRFETLQEVEAFCKKHKKADLVKLNQTQIHDLIRKTKWG